MYILCAKGKHPLFEPETDDEVTYKAKLKTDKWEYPSYFSEQERIFHQIRMAQDLIRRLAQYNPLKRYSASQSLSHPWVTRNKYDSIPKTFAEEMKMFDIE